MIEGEEELLEDDELGTNLFVYLVYFVYLLLIVCWVTENQNEIIEALLRPYYTAKRTREILISNIHLLSPQKWSQFVHFIIEKVYFHMDSLRYAPFF
jgi:hypothetical protein